MKIKKLVALVVVVVLLITAGYAISTLVPTTVVSAATQPATNAIPSSVVSAPKFSTLTDMESSLENIYNQVNPSVVLIEVVSNSSAQTPNGRANPFGSSPRQSVPQQALGSGFVWDMQGHIVTNNHVIDGATNITVNFADGTSVPGKVVGTDPASDLAVIQVSVDSSELHPVKVADSTQIKVGQFAIAIGNPFGEQNTMTTGIISAIGRSLPIDNGNTNSTATYTIPDVIQTDAPINPGNSGGVLLNGNGEVIGVTQSIESASGSSAGIGFAIPSQIVQQVVPALITTGHFDHPYIGISGTTVNSQITQAMNLKSTQRGALVISVTPNGPAAKAGLRGGSQQSTVNNGQTPVGGDIITAINGTPVKSFDDLVAYLARSTQVGQTVTLTILRNGSEQTVKLTLEARPNSSSALSGTGN